MSKYAPTFMCNSPSSKSEPLDEGSGALAAADTHGHQGVTALRPLELVKRLGQQHSTGGSQRVTEGDRTTVDVDLAHIGLGLLSPRQHDGSERLVDLDDIEIFHRQTVTVENPLGRGNRSEERRVGQEGRS